jgi:hypothetical protein
MGQLVKGRGVVVRAAVERGRDRQVDGVRGGHVVSAVAAIMVQRRSARSRQIPGGDLRGRLDDLRLSRLAWLGVELGAQALALLGVEHRERRVVAVVLQLARAGVGLPGGLDIAPKHHLGRAPAVLPVLALAYVPARSWTCPKVPHHGEV